MWPAVPTVSGMSRTLPRRILARMLRRLGWLVVGVLLAAACYEIALALGAGSVGPAPGDDVVGATAVRLVALVAMLVGAGLAFASARRRESFVPPLAPAAACFLLAFFFTYDPYYAPTLRRYSEGAVSLPWILVVMALALAAAALDARGGGVATSVVLVVVLVSVVLAADGH
jgi:hypothetical protein